MSTACNKEGHASPSTQPLGKESLSRTCEDAAHEYLEKGFPVIPLRGKKPLIKWERYQHELPTHEDITKWWSEFPNANVGIVTGAISKLVVVDMDGPEGEAWVDNNMPRTSVYQKTGKGKHAIYKYPGYKVSNSVKEIHPEVDIKGDGGYIVAEPSVHENGTKYQWICIEGFNGFDDLEVYQPPQAQTCPAPDSFSNTGAGVRLNKDLSNAIPWGLENFPCPMGNRNKTLAQLVGGWLNQNPDYWDALAKAKTWNDAQCQPPLGESELTRTVQSIYRRHVTNNPTPPQVQAEQEIFSFANLDLHSINAARFIENSPQPITWTLKDSLPQGSLGFVVANGGVGKSFFLIQLAMSLATDMDCVDGVFKAGEHGKVVCLMGEDVNDVIHHRTKNIFETFVNGYSNGRRDSVYQGKKNQVGDNLFILPGAGLDLRLVELKDGNPRPTGFYDEMLTKLKSIDGLKVVVLDPVSRFYAGNENDNVAATYFCSLLERICKETGATVIFSHHTNKAATNPNESSYNALFQGAMRGASGFTNASRWQLNFTSLKASEVKEIGGDATKYFNYICGQVVKKNVGPPEEKFYLQRIDNGVLRHFQPIFQKDVKDDLVLDMVIAELIQLNGKGERITQSQFPKTYAGLFNGYGNTKLGRVIDNGISKGRIEVRQEKGGNRKMTDYIYALESEGALDQAPPEEKSNR
jgi:RecA-family ATPase